MQKASFSSIFAEEPKSQGINVACHYMEVYGSGLLIFMERIVSVNWLISHEISHST